MPGSSAPAWSLPVSVAPVGGRYRIINPRRSGGYSPDYSAAGNRLQFPIPLPAVSATLTPVFTLSFDGMTLQAAGSGIPPDTVGDVGPNHYVQAVNSAFSIYNKSGVLMTGPNNINTLWQDGTPCQTQNQGDPVVLYDPLANRWLISQFNFVSDTNPPFYQCIAISQTPDPTGSWYAYAFNTNGTEINDYPKLAVWPDGYYMGTNESGFSAYVFDRTNMIAGAAARPTQRFSVAGQNFMLPADLDGTTQPPLNSPGYFYTMKTGNRIELWALRVNWSTPANSTFQSLATLTSSGFGFDVCPAHPMDKGSWDCIPQLGTTQTLDAIGEWPMFRFQYRNRGSYEALVGSFPADMNAAAGTDQAGIHWFELRKTGTNGSWSISNEGNYSPDSSHRWMSSAAMDRGGNIAVAYSVSSSSMYPAIRYATRLVTDPAGQLGAEVTLHAGSAPQTGINRWGDYSALTVDPSDDCTFWFTGEYLSSSAAGWRTRIGKFKIPQCSTLYLPFIAKQ